MRCQNPFAFRPSQVTFWTTVVYLALGISLIYVHETVPPLPKAGVPELSGINITQGWLDLQAITTAFHPYNSHENDDVRDYILKRSTDILTRTQANFVTEELADGVSSPDQSIAAGLASAVIFDDRISNFTKTQVWGKSTQGTYFEGNNVYVYLRGKEDPEGAWWHNITEYKKSHRTGGVLVNCHFDSVSTGYGATDDGMGCVTLLQLLSYFTISGRQPKNGIVLLFNNAEEDGLHGATAFGHSPLVNFCHTFVNLEGAAAGGRALLFRTTDLQAAQAYSHAPHPFGTVVAADSFKRGALGSQTDYKVFAEEYGQRGLDIAFYQPRARYHTEEDDARHASKNSIWHMLSAALASTKSLSETTSTKFNGPRGDNRNLVQNGKPHDGVWFDMFGSAFVAFALRGLFAWSLTLLVATPLILIVLSYILIRYDKYYFFARDIRVHSEVNDDPVKLGGWRGFFRFPVALVFAGALTILSALLVVKVNPLIVYSSSYAVWAMTISLFYFSFWLVMRGASFVRASALQRGFVHIWLFAIGWGLQVASAVLEDRFGLAGIYSLAFFQSAIFLSMVISLLDLFALPGKHDFAWQLHDAHQERDRHPHLENNVDGPSDQPRNDDEGSETAETATETTPLRASEQVYGSTGNEEEPTTFASGYRRASEPAPSPGGGHKAQPYGQEQPWSGHMPKWTWFIQFLLLAPVPVILFGNVALTASTALGQTAVDNGLSMTQLLIPAVFTILLLLPLTPFIHRVTHHIPMFLLLVFVGTLIYNLVAFPFSNNHRMKFYFQQAVDLDRGTDIVTLTGIEEFIRPVIASLPSAAGQTVECVEGPPGRAALSACSYSATGLTPNLADGEDVSKLLHVTVPTNTSDSISIDALNTRVCELTTSRPIFGFQVKGGEAADEKADPPPVGGFNFIQLYRRTWKGPWKVKFTLEDTTKSEPFSNTISDHAAPWGADDELKRRGPLAARRADPLEVTVSCLWSDANEPTNIPALLELKKYMPTWATVTKRSVGLVSVSKNYTLPA